MKKKVLSLLSAVMFGCLAYSPVLYVCAEEEADVISNGTLIYETDVITQNDYEEGFQNYALSDVTIDFAAEIRAFASSDLANVVGVVKDPPQLMITYRGLSSQAVEEMVTACVKWERQLGLKMGVLLQTFYCITIQTVVLHLVN